MLSALPTPSPLLFWGFVILPLLTCTGLAWAIGHTSGRAAGRRAGFVLVLWLGATGALGASGPHRSLPPAAEKLAAGRALPRRPQNRK